VDFSIRIKVVILKTI